MACAVGALPGQQRGAGRSARGVPIPAGGRRRWHILPILVPSVRVVHLLPAAPVEQSELADLGALHAPAEPVLPLQHSQALVPLLAAVAAAAPLQADEVEVGVPGTQGWQRAGGHGAAQDAGGGGGGGQVDVQAVVVLQVQGEGLSQGQVLQGAVNWRERDKGRVKSWGPPTQPLPWTSRAAEMLQSPPQSLLVWYWEMPQLLPVTARGAEMV